MVQKYKRTSQRQKWDENRMHEAIHAVGNGMPYKTAARIFVYQ